VIQDFKLFLTYFTGHFFRYFVNCICEPLVEVETYLIEEQKFNTYNSYLHNPKKAAYDFFMNIFD